MVKKIQNTAYVSRTMLTKGRISRGFTLVESMIAITIIMVVVASVTLSVRTAVMISTDVRYNMEAQFLAKETIEYVHNIRDTQMLKKFDNPSFSGDWLGKITQNCSMRSGTDHSAIPCIIDLANVPINPLDVDIFPCDLSSGLCPTLKFNEEKVRYGYDTGYGWAETPYTREVFISDPYFPESIVDNTTDEVLVTVRVYWEGRSGVKEVVYQESLFNWIY